MKKIKLLLFFITICIVQLRAQEFKFAVLELKTGEKIVCSLNDRPKIKHNDKTITYYTDETSFEYDTKNVAKLYFSKKSSTETINKIRLLQPNISEMNNFILLDKFEPNETIIVYSVDGHQYNSYNISSDGSLCLDLFSYEKGTYVVNSKNQSFKLIKR